MSRYSMSEKAPCFRFGPFELNAATGELCRNGIRLPIQGQPLQILELLLRAPGQMVSREQLRQALWPEGTYVDFNDSLNAGIRRLRHALEDDADQPRFIETLPRRGYRFLGTVDVIANGSGAASTSPAHMGQQNESSKPGERIATDPKSFYSARLVSAIALLIAIFTALLTGFRYVFPPPVLTDKDVIVIADFDNRTGEPVFDITLKEALAIDLRQSPFLNLLPDLRVDQTLIMMRRSPADRITPELGRDICLRTSSKALVTGSIASLGSHYALQLKATDCQTKEILAASMAEAVSREKVLQSLGEAAARLRPKLGESLASVRRFDRPLEEVTTSSLEALQAYSAGARAWAEKGDAAAVPFFEHAVELDQDFAAAYNLLHFCYGNQGKAGLALKSMRRAYLLRDRLIEPEKYFISAWYYSSVTGEIPKAIEQLQVLLQEYPRHIYIHGALGNHYEALGQIEKAAAEYREQVRLFPSEALGFNLVNADISLNRFEEAQAVLKQDISRMPDNPWLHEKSYTLAFLKDDPASMQKELDWAGGKPGIEPSALLADASTQAYYGRLTKARQVARAARDSAKRDGAQEVAAWSQTRQAFVEAEFGNQLQAREAARAGLALSSDRLSRVTAALALASAGDFDGAQQQLDALNHDYPLDTLVQNYWAPTIRAQINLSRGHAAFALELLQSAAPYELSGEWGWGGSMYPVFVRGRAYLASGDGSAAAVEFQKILDHRGLVGNAPTGALAHLYLGRACVLEARSLQGAAADNAKARARAAYKDFLTLWKDADRDLPILREAKAEYANLQ